MATRPEEPRNDEHLGGIAGLLVRLKEIVFQHMASHAVAANSPSRSERRAAKKDSKKEFSEMLDTIRLLGPSEAEARGLALKAYEEASAANPPTTGLESLQTVADDAWARICRTLDARDYLDADEVGPFVDARLREDVERLARLDEWSQVNIDKDALDEFRRRESDGS